MKYLALLQFVDIGLHYIIVLELIFRLCNIVKRLLVCSLLRGGFRTFLAGPVPLKPETDSTTIV